MRYFPLMIVFWLLQACQTTGALQGKTPQHSASWDSEKIVEATQEGYEKNLSDALQRSEDCIMSLPEEAACYFYRATVRARQATNSDRTAQFSSKIEQDFQTSISLDSRWNHGAAYRELGKWYAQNPVKRSETMEYLNKAVQIDPNYPENHLALAENRLLRRQWNEATEALQTASLLIEQWRTAPKYASWQKEAKNLENRLTADNKMR